MLLQARSLAPAIIFIDEIDAVGRTRGGAQGNDERDQTLNQMLSEMDGFQNSAQVIVMAATNRQAAAAPSAACSAQQGPSCQASVWITWIAKAMTEHIDIVPACLQSYRRFVLTGDVSLCQARLHARTL